MKGKLLKLAAIATMCLTLSSCSTYGSLNISAPFKVGPVYVNPSIGVGGNL